MTISACTSVLGMSTLAKTVVMISSLSEPNYPFSSTAPYNDQESHVCIYMDRAFDTNIDLLYNKEDHYWILTRWAVIFTLVCGN